LFFRYFISFYLESYLSCIFRSLYFESYNCKSVCPLHFISSTSLYCGYCLPSQKSLNISKGLSEAVKRRGTVNAIDKRKKTPQMYKQRSSQHCTENWRSSNTNPTKPGDGLRRCRRVDKCATIHLGSYLSSMFDQKIKTTCNKFLFSYEADFIQGKTKRSLPDPLISRSAI